MGDLSPPYRPSAGVSRGEEIAAAVSSRHEPGAGRMIDADIARLTGELVLAARRRYGV